MKVSLFSTAVVHYAIRTNKSSKKILFHKNLVNRCKRSQSQGRSCAKIFVNQNENLCYMCSLFILQLLQSNYRWLWWSTKCSLNDSDKTTCGSITNNIGKKQILLYNLLFSSTQKKKICDIIIYPLATKFNHILWCHGGKFASFFQYNFGKTIRLFFNIRWH